LKLQLFTLDCIISFLVVTSPSIQCECDPAIFLCSGKRTHVEVILRSLHLFQ
jgi:hypothetical protein